MILACSIRQVHIVCVTYRKQCNEVHVEPFLQRALKHPKLGCKGKQKILYLSADFDTSRTICINAMYNVKKFIICKSIYAEYLSRNYGVHVDMPKHEGFLDNQMQQTKDHEHRKRVFLNQSLHYQRTQVEFSWKQEISHKHHASTNGECLTILNNDVKNHRSQKVTMVAKEYSTSLQKSFHNERKPRNAPFKLLP